MSNINITNLTFAYDGSYDNVFEDISLQINTSWKLGLIGRNGRGKTTLLNLMLGKYEYRGSISADVDFVRFPQHIADESELTIDIIRTLSPEAEDWQIYKEFALIELSEDILYRPYSTLSGGEKTKVLLSALFLNDNGFPLIDEPTNHLDMASREKIAEYLKKKNGFILVSHDRTLLDAVVDHIISIDRNGIDVQKGNYSSWQANRDMRDNFELAENKKLKKDIGRLSAAADRNADWSDKVERTKNGTRIAGIKADKGYIGHKAAKMMSRAKAIETRTQHLIDEKSSLLKNIETSAALSLSPLKFHSERLILLKDISVAYDGVAVIKDFDLEINQGERISLYGKNGSGKSSILMLICGEDIPYTGELIKNGQLKISYVPQSAEFLAGNLSDYALQKDIDESLFKAILQKLGFNKNQYDKNMQDYSAGQKKKVLIAGSLCEKAHLYVWDEPLNYIDIISRLQIEELLSTGNQTIIFVEHDKTFCDKIATRTIML